MNYLDYFCTTAAFLEDLQEKVGTEWIKTIYLKGSLTKGELSESSDIDLCIVWDDRYIGLETLANYLSELYEVVAQYAKRYVYFSVPKIMSYRSWIADVHTHFVGFGQESYYTGKVVYGDNLLDEIMEWRPNDQLLEAMIYRELLFRLHKANYVLDQARQSFKKTLNLKHIYRIIKLYLQLYTGRYYSNYNDIVNTFITLFPQDAISSVLNNGFQRTIISTPDVLHDLQNQVDWIYHRLASFKAKIGNDPTYISVVGGSNDKFPSFTEIRGSKEFAQDFRRYFDPVAQMIAEAKAGEEIVSSDSTFLQLSLRSKMSYISYNWVNKIFEQQLGRAQYHDNYIFDYLLLLPLITQRKLCLDIDELYLLHRNHLRIPFFDLVIPKYANHNIVLHLIMENEMFDQDVFNLIEGR